MENINSVTLSYGFLVLLNLMGDLNSVMLCSGHSILNNYLEVDTILRLFGGGIAISSVPFTLKREDVFVCVSCFFSSRLYLLILPILIQFVSTIQMAGIEPARAYTRKILSLVCLPIPPHLQKRVKVSLRFKS